MGKPTVTTPSPVGEAEEATSKSTIIVGKVKDICGEHACMLTNFLRIVGVSNSDFIPHNCKSKDFYCHLIRHVIKPDQLLRGQITSLLTVKPAPGAELKEWKIFDNSCSGVQAQENWEVSLYCSRYIL
ncbi:uncharacterized protein LOC142640213 [Castanea sativa]|uniref:uncharacterized protein LOC142640213 n=1 Tax=Castanea sativa TaxID=21020 RepID=UPI003F6504C7